MQATAAYTMADVSKPFVLEEAKIFSSNEIALAEEARRRALSHKQASDMESFWEQYVEGDRHLLGVVCSEFVQYTVETLLRNPFDYDEFFEREIKQESWHSSALGFDAWSVIHSEVFRGNLLHR